MTGVPRRGSANVCGMNKCLEESASAASLGQRGRIVPADLGDYVRWAERAKLRRRLLER